MEGLRSSVLPPAQPLPAVRNEQSVFLAPLGARASRRGTLCGAGLGVSKKGRCGGLSFL